MEVTIDKAVGGEKILSLTGRFKTLHLAFPASCRPMRILRTIVGLPQSVGNWRGLSASAWLAISIVA
jgi:hypothetical protein